MNSLEGYVRQVIGWREFMRGIYQSYSDEMETKNFFKQNRKMKKSWYEGTTGLPPLDYAIKNAVNYGWSHHIERLMILSNIMNLCEIKPTIVYKWFMEMFVIHQIGSWFQMFMEWVYSVMEEYLQQNHIFVVQAIL